MKSGKVRNKDVRRVKLYETTFALVGVSMRMNLASSKMDMNIKSLIRHGYLVGGGKEVLSAPYTSAYSHIHPSNPILNLGSTLGKGELGLCSGPQINYNLP